RVGVSFSFENPPNLAALRIPLVHPIRSSCSKFRRADRSVSAIDLLSVDDASALSGANVKKCKLFLGRRGNFLPRRAAPARKFSRFHAPVERREMRFGL